jgi:hypothetical protein
MKKILFIIILSASLPVFSQNLEFSMSSGSGMAYIFENLDKKVNINYGVPISLTSAFKYTPGDSRWGLKLRLQFIEASIKGINWSSTSYPEIDGFVYSWTTSFIIENNVPLTNSAYGYSFGLGITNETFSPVKNDKWYDEATKYPSLILGAHWDFRINSNLDFQILPTIMVQDPYRSIGYLFGNVEPRIAREDLSIMINFGVRYILVSKQRETLQNRY